MIFFLVRNSAWPAISLRERERKAYFSYRVDGMG